MSNSVLLGAKIRRVVVTFTCGLGIKMPLFCENVKVTVTFTIKFFFVGNDPNFVR